MGKHTKILLRILGFTLIITGLIFTIKPEIISQNPLPTDVFQSIEQRIKWGFLIGLGILFLFHHKFRPWLLTVSAILFSLTAGFVTARLIGIVLVGVVIEQFYWLVVELVSSVIFGLWYHRQRSI